MAIRSGRRRSQALCLVLFAMSLLQACAEVDANLKKAVVIKYAHVANVHQFQGTPDGSNQRLVTGVQPGSFWAVFDVCSIDVQGSALAGMQYEAARFVADAGSGSYGPLVPGAVNFAGTPMSSNSVPVLATVQNTFGLGTASQYFPKGYYPTLKSRIVIFVDHAPAGYHGEAIALRYDGQPEVAAIVQNAGTQAPADLPFYLSGSGGIGSACP